MKKFTFPLGRVLDWRQAQARMEEIRLEQLHGELRGVEASAARAHAELASSERGLRKLAAVTGQDLRALDSFKHAVIEECRRLEAAAEGCRRRIVRQSEIVMQKRREARLLEKLRERKFAEWKTEMGRSVDREAEELYLVGRSTGGRACPTR